MENKNKDHFDDSHGFEFKEMYWNEIEPQVDQFNKKQRRKKWMILLSSLGLIILFFGLWCSMDSREIETIAEVEHVADLSAGQDKHELVGKDKSQVVQKSKPLSKNKQSIAKYKNAENKTKNNFNSESIKKPISKSTVKDKIVHAEELKRNAETNIVNLTLSDEIKIKDSKNAVRNNENVALVNDEEKLRNRFDELHHLALLQNIINLNERPLDKTQVLRKEKMKYNWGLYASLSSFSAFQQNDFGFNTASIGLLNSLSFGNGLSISLSPTYRVVKPSEFIIEDVSNFTYGFGYEKRSFGLVPKYLHYAALPITAKYGISRFEISGGIELGYLVAAVGEGRSYDVVLQENDTGYIDPLSDHIVYAKGLIQSRNLNNFQADVLLGLGYKATSQLKFVFQSRYKIITPFETNTPNSSKQHYGLDIGIEYLFVN